jgi:hypothetical protein
MKPIAYNLKGWLKNLVSVKAISAILSSFGSLWLIIEITTFFFGNDSMIVGRLKSIWFIFLLIGIVISISMCKPKNSFISKLNNRDISIELVIGDFFRQEGALIIGTNTTFDTHISRELISESSIQGQFTRIYYGDETQIDKEILHGLNGISSETLSGRRIGKSVKYPIGTTIRLSPRERTAYMLSMANINEYGVASGTFEELKIALSNLWIFISSRGLKENLVIPILGSGFTRLVQSREEIIREIIKSFVAACSESAFCDKLTIIVSPNDIEKHKINIQELEKYIYHICRYTIFANDAIATGKPV